MVDRELKLRKREFGVVKIVTNATWDNKDLKLLWHLIMKKYSSQAKKLYSNTILLEIAIRSLYDIIKSLL